MSTPLCKSSADAAAMKAIASYKASIKRAHFRAPTCAGVYGIQIMGPDSAIPSQFGPRAYRESFVVVVKEEFCNHDFVIDRTIYTVFVDGQIRYSVTNPNEGFFRDLEQGCLSQTRSGAIKYLHMVINRGVAA